MLFLLPSAIPGGGRGWGPGGFDWGEPETVDVTDEPSEARYSKLNGTDQHNVLSLNFIYLIASICLHLSNTE